jgi:hypothetical protein
MYDWIIVTDIHRINRELDETTDRRRREALQNLLRKKNDALAVVRTRNAASI